MRTPGGRWGRMASRRRPARLQVLRRQPVRVSCGTKPREALDDCNPRCNPRTLIRGQRHQGRSTFSMEPSPCPLMEAGFSGPFREGCNHPIRIGEDHMRRPELKTSSFSSNMNSARRPKHLFPQARGNCTSMVKDPARDGGRNTHPVRWSSRPTVGRLLRGTPLKPQAGRLPIA